MEKSKIMALHKKQIKKSNQKSRYLQLRRIRESRILVADREKRPWL